MKTKSILSFVFCIAFINSVSAQPSQDIKGDAAFLFAYFPKEGKEAEFSNGYKKHLEWHRNHSDPLVWYGWYVSTGDRIGMFVDGTFGISFEAFDNRIKPTEDATNFRKTTTPFADAAWRKIYKLQPDLSTSTRLEDWNPSSNIQVNMLSIAPGREPLFEETISELVSALNNNSDNSNREFTLYRQLAGGNLPAYLLMVPQEGYAYFDSNEAITTFSHTIKRTFKGKKAEDLLDNLSQSILEIDSETWIYREDLSYFPR